MSALVNAMGVTLGLGLLGLSGWGIVVILNKEPYAYTLISKEGTESTKSYTNGIGNIDANKQVLVADIDKNAAWFNWSFKNQLNPMTEEKEKGNMDSEFANITEGYGTKATSLNKVCDSFYKKTGNDLSADNKKKNSIKWFCSINREKDIVTTST